MATMYDVHKEFDAIWAWLEESDGEVTPEIAALTEVAEADLREKAARYVHVIRDIEATISGIDAEVVRLQDRAAKYERRVEYLRSVLLGCVQRYGKFEAADTTISSRRSTSVAIVGDVPERYMVTPEPKPPEPLPDKRLLAADLKAGVDVPGAKLEERYTLVLK